MGIGKIGRTLEIKTFHLVNKEAHHCRSSMPKAIPDWRKSEIGFSQTREAWICRSGLGQMIVFKDTLAYHMIDIY